MRLEAQVKVNRDICFNPRICKRCDIVAKFHALLIKVSIHASVKDATNNLVLSNFGFAVSIHASVKDATQ